MLAIEPGFAGSKMRCVIPTRQMTSKTNYYMRGEKKFKSLAALDRMPPRSSHGWLRGQKP